MWKAEAFRYIILTHLRATLRAGCGDTISDGVNSLRVVRLHRPPLLELTIVVGVDLCVNPNYKRANTEVCPYISENAVKIKNPASSWVMHSI
jgi:hypothetical protein